MMEVDLFKGGIHCKIVYYIDTAGFLFCNMIHWFSRIEGGELFFFHYLFNRQRQQMITSCCSLWVHLLWLDEYSFTPSHMWKQPCSKL